MFTGLIEKIGRVARLETGREPASLVVAEAEMAGAVALGESVAASGACLTVAGVAGDEIAFDVVGETLRRTNLGALRAGDRVNLERALRVGDRLGGHLVQGHVDGLAEVTAVETRGDWRWMRFRLAEDLAAFVVEKGSVAVDGVSLTVAEVSAAEFAVALIPTTLGETTLGDRRPGDRVNVETDLIGKYVARFVGRTGAGPSDGLTLGKLAEEGFT